ncbi:MAG TPA: hypothetical protein VFR17_00010 [Mycobacterium sp.]|nr:hypothetical protein [Mycobacterium sp.]
MSIVVIRAKTGYAVEVNGHTIAELTATEAADLATHIASLLRTTRPKTTTPAKWGVNK